MFRYITVAWNAADSSKVASSDLICRRIQAALPDMRAVCQAEGLRVFVAGLRRGTTDVYALANGDGVVLGKLFRMSESEHGVPAAIALDQAETSAILRSAGRHLVTNYWGRYVAFGRDHSAKSTWILRDPSGGLPCYMTTFDGVTIVFSWVEDCCALDLQQFAIDWKYVGALATEFPLQGRTTGLDGVSEVQMGECIQLLRDASQVRAQHWNPVEVSRRDPIRNVNDAIERARCVVQGCISAWASCYPRIALMLSGGLDSSIVLACLTRAPSKPDVRCVNYYDTAAAGDERQYARLAAAHARSDLMEIQFDPGVIPAEAILQFSRMACPMPWPEAFYTPLNVSELAEQWGMPVVFDGNFGDSLFFYYGDRALRLADYMHDRGFWGRDLLSIAIMTALDDRQSLWSALAGGIRKGLLRPRCAPPDHFGKYRWFATRETLAGAKGYQDFLPPYVLERPRVAPGKMEQILGLAIAPAYYDPVAHRNDVDRVPVLTSQPMRELFLRIPTHILTTQGDTRAIAKRAFADGVPREIRERAVKGVVGNFFAQFLQHNERFAREMLLDGLLVRNGILDRGRLEEFFAARKYTNVRRATELALYHLSLEAWVQSWASSSRMRAAA